MNAKQKEQLEAVVESIVNEDTAAAKSAFHEYLRLKSQAILLGEAECDDEEKDEDKSDEKEDKDEDKEDKPKKSKKADDEEESEEDEDKDEDKKPAFLKKKK